MKTMIIVLSADEGKEIDSKAVINQMEGVFHLESVKGFSMYNGDEYSIRKKIPILTSEELISRFGNKKDKVEREEQ